MIRFSVIGVAHDHIFAQVKMLLDAGATLVSWHAFDHEGPAADDFAERHPQARRESDERAILDDPTVRLIVTSTVPADRAAVCVRAMQHGKDAMSDKPGATTLEQLSELRRVQAETGRIYSICFSERFENRSTVRAGELVKQGAIGRVLQTVGLGPHRLRAPTRLPYFFQRGRYGGILCDIASHQFDQFLHFTGCTSAEVVTSQVGNLAHPQYPGLEDFGDVIVRGRGPQGVATGYVRVDWFTPDGLPVWGDGRMMILGTEGYIELRKYLDVAGRPGANHLFLVTKTGTEYLSCEKTELPYGRQLVYDVLNRTETAMSQAHCFAAMELALKAQQQATILTAPQS